MRTLTLYRDWGSFLIPRRYCFSQ